MVLCESGYLSAGLYFIGLGFVLLAGAGYQALLNAEKWKKGSKERNTNGN
jgi:hypothetical protein